MHLSVIHHKSQALKFIHPKPSIHFAPEDAKERNVHTQKVNPTRDMDSVHAWTSQTKGATRKDRLAEERKWSASGALLHSHRRARRAEVAAEHFSTSS